MAARLLQRTRELSDLARVTADPTHPPPAEASHALALARLELRGLADLLPAVERKAYFENRLALRPLFDEHGVGTFTS